jgi:hypothetical protein
MSKNLALTLARAKNNGIREGIDAVCEAMALAHYNAAIELELDEREVGAFYTRMRTELLEILAQGGRDTFTDEMQHAIAVAYEKVGVEPMERKKMDDLISRKALLKRLHDVGGCGAPPDSWADGYDKAIDLAYGMAENAPAVDAALVVHGRWGEYESFPLTPSMNDCPCSVCKTHFSPSSIILMKYCPNCGAKMDGGNDNDCQRGDCSF